METQAPLTFPHGAEAEAANPSTPIERLLLLVSAYPDQVAFNPILPLLALEDPAMGAWFAREILLGRLARELVRDFRVHRPARVVSWSMGAGAAIPLDKWSGWFGSFGVVYRDNCQFNFQRLQKFRFRGIHRHHMGHLVDKTSASQCLHEAFLGLAEIRSWARYLQSMHTIAMQFWRAYALETEPAELLAFKQRMDGLL